MCRQGVDSVAGNAYHPSVTASVNFASKDSTLWTQTTQRRHDLSSLAQSQQVVNDARLSHIGSTGYPRLNKKHKPVSKSLLSMFIVPIDTAAHHQVGSN